MVKRWYKMGYAIGIGVESFFRGVAETKPDPCNIGVGNGSFRRQADVGTLTTQPRRDF
jgi:hypothetical protein